MNHHLRAGCFKKGKYLIRVYKKNYIYIFLANSRFSEEDVDEMIEKGSFSVFTQGVSYGFFQECKKLASLDILLIAYLRPVTCRSLQRQHKLKECWKM